MITSTHLSYLNLSSPLKNSKKIIDFHKLVKRNSYDQEKHGSISYSKILKFISDNNLRNSSNNMSLGSYLDNNQSSSSSNSIKIKK